MSNWRLLFYVDVIIHARPNPAAASKRNRRHIDELTHLPPGQNGRHFADDTFKRIFLNGNARISIQISLKFVTKVFQLTITQQWLS